MARTKNLRSERAQSRARRRQYTRLGLGALLLVLLAAIIFLVVRDLGGSQNPAPAPTTAVMDTPAPLPENAVSASPTSKYDLSAIKSIGIGRTPFYTTASGLEYQDVALGSGNISAVGDYVAVQYKGWLLDGKKFDDSGEDAFEFLLGSGMVIPGWDEGLQGMQVGGRRILVIPAELAYGSQGIEGLIPPDSVLVFEVFLVSLTQPR